MGDRYCSKSRIVVPQITQQDILAGGKFRVVARYEGAIRETTTAIRCTLALESQPGKDWAR